jgi:hypothetical protein
MTADIKQSNVKRDGKAQIEALNRSIHHVLKVE